VASAASPYLRHRFPPEIIAHCVLLYMRFPLSFRAVEEMLLLRGVQVSYETMLPRVVGESHLLAANALGALSNNLTRFIGPPLGGALLGVLGLSSLVLVDSASYLFSALSMAKLIGSWALSVEPTER